ncbi:Csu type fimbrial protein [Nodularia spumigena]|jgi:spore coat protein U-like protein|uniref:Csu type fimbrial protein n=1 Tax=Nodularia spumigena TaxID=70799 RepID=UPI002B200B27|nr:spore coat U domain-containing protein [Nodularia spumigena]MEA5556542.1 spore coat U domain-containing protein [Nodularia spumigena CH309]
MITYTEKKFIHQKTYFLNPIFFVNRGTYTMIRRFALASAIFIAAGSAAPAMANTSSANIDVSATVPVSCTISANPIAFGNYDPIGTHANAALDITGSLTTTCTSGAPAVITLGQGGYADTGSSDAAPLRRLSAGNNNFLAYQIFKEQTRATNWGNTNTTGVTVTGTGSPMNTEIFARIPSGQTAALATSYTDTVIVTITY